MKLRWDPRALQDLTEIRSYIATKASPGAAERVRRRLRNRAESLRKNPFLGVVSSHAEMRVLAPTRYPYRIYYTAQRNEVIILHIRHTAHRAPHDLEP